MAKALFLHAHPDDEAIFTGGTISLLKDSGHQVIVVFATGGELGIDTDDEYELAHLRQLEARNSAKILGVDHIQFLDFYDSGLDPNNFPDNAFATTEIDIAAEKLSEIIRDHKVDSLFFDDPYGVYGHPDHVQAHKVGLKASQMCSIEDIYFTTVDREYLHFVATHLVEEASNAHPHGSQAQGSQLGMSSIEITHTVNIADAIDIKRASMTAHKSQISDTSSAFTMDDRDFKNVYGYEWYVRHPWNAKTKSILGQLPLQ